MGVSSLKNGARAASLMGLGTLIANLALMAFPGA
jgi:hypothetical protein